QLLVSQGKRFEPVSGPWINHQNSEDMAALFFDADGDGDQDLYVVSGSSEWEPDADPLADRLYLNQGNASQPEFIWAENALPKNKLNGISVCGADFDQDGDVDLFVGSRSIPGQYPLMPKSQLLINEGGRFQEADESVSNGLSEVGLVNSAVWSDFDNDGWVDLLVALDWGPVSVFKNIEGRLENDTQRLGLGSRKGWWRGILAYDLDQDGDMDYVVTNQGQNTKYHADKKHPHRLYFSDFDNSGTIDLVETKFEGDRELPIRGRSCSSHAMPYIKEKFKTYESFALADLTEIYQPEQICEQNSMEINWLDTTVLWNVEGEFAAMPLPHLAQISPSFGIDAGDYDGDGVVDLFIANNFYPNQIETGFMDGGLSWVLKGIRSENPTEKVRFETLWPLRSGVVLPNDSNGVAGTDIDQDGDRDLLVQENSGELIVLENQSNLSEQVRVRIQSKLPLAGTRLNFEGPHSKRSFEYNAGGSYLGQSDLQQGVVLSKSELKKYQSVEIVYSNGLRATQKIDTDSIGNEWVIGQSE
ncbi:MAG: VCBS repeat-containing protein, partial [Planctomycetota bacterium]